MNKKDLKRFKTMLEESKRQLLLSARKTLTEESSFDTDDLPDEIDLSDPDFALWVDRQVVAHKAPGYAIANISLKPIGGIAGDISAEQMEIVADLAERYSFDDIRSTHVQNLVLPHVRKQDLYAVWQALDAAGLDLVPCINDTYVTDFMANARNEVKLVDFEYASNNDRCADLAIWFYELFFPEPIEDELIEAYFGACRPELKARIAVYKVLISIKWTLWASVQRRLSTLRFDYAKYGAWLNLRGRSARGPEEGPGDFWPGPSSWQNDSSRLHDQRPLPQGE